MDPKRRSAPGKSPELVTDYQEGGTPQSELPKGDEPSPATPPATRFWYQLEIDGPITVGVVQAVRNARLQLTKKQAADLNDLHGEGTLRPLGI